MHNTLKRSVFVLLAIIMILPAALSSCKSKEPEKSKLTHVYDTQEISLPEGVDYPGFMTLIDDQLYFSTNTWEERKNTFTLYRMGVNGGEANSVLEIAGENIYVNTMTPLSDGKIWLSIESSGSDPETGEWFSEFSLKQYGTNGEELLNIDLKEMFPDQEYFYFNSITADSFDNIYLVRENFVVQISPNGELLASCEVDTTYIDYLYIIDDLPYVLTYNPEQAGNQFSQLDLATGKLTAMESVKPVSNYLYGIHPAKADSAYDFYYNNMTALCGFNMETGANDELCNWINSDINGYNMGTLVIIDDTQLLCSSGEVNADGDYVNKLYLMTQIPEEEIPEKFIMTLAALDVPYEIREQILQFNRANDEYRITIRNYGNYNTAEDYTIGQTRFNNDLVSGDIPDIMILANEIPVESYASKGLFADLYTFIDADPEIKREDYLTNIFDAMATDGKLYQFTPTFSVRTLVGKNSVVGTGKSWTVSDMMNLAQRYPNAQLFRDMPRETFINDLITLLIGEFVNKDTGECSFDSENFIQYLNFIATLSEKSIWEDYDWENDDGTFMENYETGFRSDLYLLNNAYLSSFDGYWTMKAGLFGDDINLIGYPTSGSCGSAILPSMRLSISSQSQLADGAWQFVRTFLLDDYHNEYGQWQFSIKLSALEMQAKDAMEVDSWTDEETGEVITYPGMYYLGNEEIEIGEIDQPSVDEVMNFLKSLTLVSSYDSEMSDIIMEEINAFLGGGKTAEQAAQLIQNRVQTYVSESR